MVKIATLTFGGLLVASLLSYGWQMHEQARKEAQLRQFCKELAQFTSAIQQRGNEASRAELMGGVYAQGMVAANCQQFRH